MRTILESIEGEFRRYRTRSEEAIVQLTDPQLAEPVGERALSIATIAWHVAGNLESRFTDFLDTDGEKPWRDREGEFQSRKVPRAVLLEKWDTGWRAVFDAMAALQDHDLQRTVTVRGVPHSVLEALHRSLAHTCYHAGQIVYVAKVLRGRDWRWLTIPPGGTAAYNRAPEAEQPPGWRAPGDTGPPESMR